VVQLGLQHEQQHQELMLTDIKHAFFVNPLRPAYHAGETPPSANPCSQLRWHSVKASIAEVGSEEDASRFVYDNETPRHRTYIQPHEIATRCITNGEYLRFIEDRGYSRPDFWLSLGWSHVMNEGWDAPLYWVQAGDQWQQFTLAGLTPLKLDEPVCHVSYFEADAFARWAGHRLPTEFEWEVTAATSPITGIFADELFESEQAIHPQVDCHAGDSLSGIFGNLWEWTSSHYSPYPGYRAAPGALGEYNGKFMCNQFVLRGGSCATSKSHIRATYRNFFPPETRWQFSGIRLARGW
jgi:ergothioneine biosynthesis protein EgtB